MNRILTAFACVFAALLASVGLLYFQDIGKVYAPPIAATAASTPKPASPQATTHEPSAAPAALPNTAPPLPDSAIDLNRYSGSPEEKLAKALRDSETGSFSDVPVTVAPTAPPRTPQAQTNQAAAVCGKSMAWQLVATKRDPSTQKELQRYEGTLCLDYAPGSKQTLIGASHWPCCPGARTDGMVGSIQGNAILLDRQLSGGAQRYTGTVQFTGTQALQQATIRGTWAGRNDATAVQGNWWAAPFPAPTPTN